MTIEELKEYCTKQLDKKSHVEFDTEIFESITNETAQELTKSFSNKTMIKLPDYEIAFFEWLKEADPAVWQDLWGSSDEEPYIVGMLFLSMLKDKKRGFPICDLLTCDNYYFTLAHLPDQESRDFLTSVQDRFMGKNKLTPAQLLVLEIGVGAIDIWHFCYAYKLDIQTGKNIVAELNNDGILVHLTSAEHLASFIEF